MIIITLLLEQYFACQHLLLFISYKILAEKLEDLSKGTVQLVEVLFLFQRICNNK